MPHIVIQEEVDIYQLPHFDEAHIAPNMSHEITIGDLHANPIKLLFMLVKHGVAKNISPVDYSRLIEIYKIGDPDRLTKELLEEFDGLLNKIEFNKHVLIRLIGDELADRGNNDYFTLKIFEQLKKYNVPLEIMVSNHSIEFIQATELQNHFHAPMLEQGHAASMEHLEILVQKGLVSRDTILKIAQDAYKPTLRAISYSLSEDKQEIIIYSHAAIGVNTIQSIAEKLGIEYKDTSATELAQTIDEINKAFQIHVHNNSVHTLYTYDNMYAAYSDFVDLSKAPFECLMWNRKYEKIQRPALHFGYNIHFVHGHDSEAPTAANIYNLDNTLGKQESWSVGLYTILHSYTNNIPSNSEETQCDIEAENTPPIPMIQYVHDYSARPNALIVCAGTVTCTTVDSMGAGFSLFKKIFNKTPAWKKTLQNILNQYHKKEISMPAYQTIAEQDGYLGGVATVPCLSCTSYKGLDARKNIYTEEELCNEYKAAIRGAIAAAKALSRPLVIQPLGIGVYSWLAEKAAALFAEVIKEKESTGLEINILLYEKNEHSPDQRFFRALNQLIVTSPSKAELYIPPEPKSAKEKLYNITLQLIQNIENKAGSRLTSGRNSKKVNILHEKLKGFDLSNHEEMDVNAQQQYINELLKICAIKRHAFHFWHTPDSLNECKTLLKENGFIIDSGKKSNCSMV